MKLGEKIGFILFTIGLIFKFLHYPGAPILMIIGIINLIVLYAIKLIKKNITLNILINSTSTFWLIFILFRIQYWDYASIPLLLATSLTIYTVLTIIKKKNYLNFLTILFGVTITLSTILMFTPAHKVYYLINLNSTLNQEIRVNGYDAWNKYSWFLYIDGQNNKALLANDKAIIAAKNYFNIIKVDGSSILLCLNQNRQRIIYDTWYKFESCKPKYY